jgi:polyketide cyclase/dehydrase/lipid transport protein
MIKIIVIGLIVVIAAILVLAATRPDSFRVERSAQISAPPEKILSLVNDFHQWGAWSPYEKLDPAMKRTYAGAAAGKGAVYEWEGNSKAGQGRMQIIDAAPTRTAIQLDFIKPFAANDIAEFTALPQGDATRVTWSMQGRSPFIHKVVGLFLNMDKMIGGDFETGLANLKTLAEKASP